MVTASGFYTGEMYSIMVPFVVLIIPLYQLMVGIGWVDSIPALIFPWIFSAYGTFLMRQFFITIPKELEEAAFIDGASRWTVMWRIYVPLSLPALLGPFLDVSQFAFVLILRLGRLFRLFRVLRFIPNLDHLVAGIRRALRASIG